MSSGTGISKAELVQKLIDSGDRTRLIELVRRRLVESGWQHQVQQRCQEMIKEKGVENVGVDELVSEVTPYARKQVPDAVKNELLQQIRAFIQEHSGITDL